MKKLLLFTIAAMLAVVSYSQDTDTVKYWKRSGMGGINLSQVALSNWAAGGDASVAFQINAAYTADYKKDKTLWTNRLEFAYGLSNTSSQGTRKTDDKIYISSTYGYKISKNWYASASTTFNTQFADGYNYAVSSDNIISKFMAPGYLTAGLGFTWTPKSWFTATLSPSSWRGTFVMDDVLSDAGVYGVTPGKNLLSEFGANAVAEAKYEFLPNMTIYSRLSLFSNYLEKPQNVDLNWNNQLTMKVNKWFAATVTLNMLYDDNTKIAKEDGTSSPELQIKEVLGVGLNFSF